MRQSRKRAAMRRYCYAALPLAGVLIVPAFYLMPNRKYAGPVTEADLEFQLGFALGLVGVCLAVCAILTLVLVAED